MIKLNGKSVCNGVTNGEIKFLKKNVCTVQNRQIEDTAQEIVRYEKAKAEALQSLTELHDKALQEAGEECAQIFSIHQLMLEDSSFCDEIRSEITRLRCCAEYAVQKAAAGLYTMFASMEDTYMKERAADVKDVADRLISILCRSGDNGLQLAKPCIIAADDLAPSETIQLDKKMVLGFITAKGSINSHTAILARTMNIPAIVSVGDELNESCDGCQGILDGFSGEIYIDPDASVFEKTQEMRGKLAVDQQQFERQRGKPTVTQDGKRLHLCANIGSVADASLACENDAEGIGLFRSEFLFLESKDYPSEERQFSVYSKVLRRLQGKRVVIRTLDIGADKQAAYFNLPKEENPALGMRAIRVSLTRPDVFKIQIRALYRASIYGRLAIMFPMIISLSEVLAAKKLVEEVKDELKAAGIAYDEKVELGVMIETPAAALISDDLAKVTDFFSIGTNDLTQYTLAIDRQNAALDEFFKPDHKAVLRLLQIVANNAHKNGIWVGICGELAANMQLTETFLALGIDELSVSPGCILPLRKKIREISVELKKEGILASLL